MCPVTDLWVYRLAEWLCDVWCAMRGHQTNRPQQFYTTDARGFVIATTHWWTCRCGNKATGSTETRIANPHFAPLPPQETNG